MAELQFSTKKGDRLRLVGHHPVHIGSLDSFTRESMGEYLNFSRLDRNEEKANQQIDTWVTIGFTSRDGYWVKYDNYYGFVDIEENLDLSELQALAQNGLNIEKQRIALEHGLAKQCVVEGLTPKYEPTVLKSLHDNGYLNIGFPLIIDGIDYGNIKDCLVDDGKIFVKTDKNEHMFSTVNFKNEYIKLTNPCYTLQTDIGMCDFKSMEQFLMEHCTQIDCKLYNIELHGQNDKNICEYYMKELFENNDFMYNVAQKASSYAQSLGLNNINDVQDVAAINNVLEMIQCEMVDYGYRETPGDRPSQAALDYIQSIGYSQDAMKVKAEIMQHWLKDKDLTINETIVAEAISQNKSLHVLTEIVPGSVKQQYKKHELLWSKLNNTNIEPSPHNDGAVKLKATHKDLSTGQIDCGTIKMKNCERIWDLTSHGQGPRLNDSVVYTDDAIYTLNFDVSNEYSAFGGYDSDKALLIAQETNMMYTNDLELQEDEHTEEFDNDVSTHEMSDNR